MKKAMDAPFGAALDNAKTWGFWGGVLAFGACLGEGAATLGAGLVACAPTLATGVAQGVALGTGERWLQDNTPLGWLLGKSNYQKAIDKYYAAQNRVITPWVCTAYCSVDSKAAAKQWQP